jgi:hypothetical protein
MSFCYDFQKWIIVSLASITISLTVGLISIAHGQTVDNQTTANTTDFSIHVPNGWVYREDYLFDNGILLTANEFADRLITDNASALIDIMHGGILAELRPDPHFPLKNAPVEVYAKHASKFANNLFPTYENATIGGERAIKIFVNSTDIASKLGKTNIPVSLVTTSYYVMHNDQPYVLDYMGNAKDYQKYLPQFEQIVKTFKFVK